MKWPRDTSARRIGRSGATRWLAGLSNDSHIIYNLNGTWNLHFLKEKDLHFIEDHSGVIQFVYMDVEPKIGGNVSQNGW